jgi:Uma2 family endonuclease
MITRQEALLMGANSPKDHQRVISRLIIGLGNLYSTGSLKLEPFPETPLNEGEPSPVPDVSLFDNIFYETPVIIEVNHAGGIKSDLKKIQALIDEENYGIVEGFIFDYKRKEWHKYKRGEGIIIDKPSFCDVINLDLATLL